MAKNIETLCMPLVLLLQLKEEKFPVNFEEQEKKNRREQFGKRCKYRLKKKLLPKRIEETVGCVDGPLASNTFIL